MIFKKPQAYTFQSTISSQGFGGRLEGILEMFPRLFCRFRVKIPVLRKTSETIPTRTPTTVALSKL